MNSNIAIKDAIEKSIHEGPVEYLADLQGYSGKKLIAALQRVSMACLKNDTCYLEIGVYRGLTLTSVGKVLPPEVKVFGIDNFALFDKEGKNQLIIQEALNKHGVKNAQLINEDYEDALEHLEKHIGTNKVGVYFIDGPHDYRSQLMCLELARKHLAPGAVIFVDDSNYEHVRQANADFLVSHPEFKLLYENYTDMHPENLNDISVAKEGWWDGINILIHDPENKLERKYPPTQRVRIKFENEHMIHAMQANVLAPFTHYMFQSFFTFRFKHFARAFILYRRKKKAYYKSGLLPKGKYINSNTYSDGLKEWMNTSIK
jgi:predicted O-methyltransferase YrrM